MDGYLSLLTTSNRLLRLLLGYPDGIRDSELLPQRCKGVEAICEGIELRIYCVSLDARIALKTLIGLPAELQIVTDTGELRRICGIVAEASQGESDGGLASYQLVVRDALAILDLSASTRVFLNQSELDVVRTVLNEIRHANPTLGVIFEIDASAAANEQPIRQQIIQSNESTGDFIRRLLKRRGIGWFFRPGRSSTAHAESPDDTAYLPAHTMVLFGDGRELEMSPAGRVRFHRNNATEERDTITGWCGVRSLRPGRITRFSWDYSKPGNTGFMEASAISAADQGDEGSQLAAGLEHYLIEAPHVRDNYDDLCELAQQAMRRSDFESKCYYAEGGVRDCSAGEYIGLDGHPDLDGHPEEEREFIILRQHFIAQNNLPKDYDARIDRLFSRNHWHMDSVDVGGERPWFPRSDLRFLVRMTCVRRDIRFVPAYDPRKDLPATPMQTALVVGPRGEEVHCDAQGRVKVRFSGTREQDHVHANNAGASDTDSDSAWVRVASGWAGPLNAEGSHFGTLGLPRPGTEVLLAFLGGDPDKPIIVGQLYNASAKPPQFGLGDLPGNRYLTGIKSREIRGQRANQLRLDDTHGQISAQLASEHGRSELNLGWLSEPRQHGEGAARGEGAELRTDHQLALRAGAGMLLSAWERLDDKQLERDDYLKLMDECVALFRKLGKCAADSMALPVDDQPQAALQTALRQWENGSNTGSKGADGGAAIIGITAPEGISFATSKAMVSYAAANTDIVAGQHLQLSAAQRFNLNAGRGVSLFAQQEGISAIAQQGKVLVQSQHGDITVNASGELQLTASEGRLVGTAQEIVLISKGGSFVKINDGITIGTTGKMVFNAASFEFLGPKSIAAAMPEFRDADPVERLVLRDTSAYALDSSFALDQLQAFAQASDRGEFIALILPIFGYDIPAPTYLRLYDALRAESFPNAKILLTKGGNHLASFDNESMEIRVRIKAAVEASENKEAAWELLTILLHEFGHYVDAMLRTKLYQPDDGDAPGADASDDEGAKLAYALVHFDLVKTSETTFATLKSPEYSGELRVNYDEACAAVRASQNQHAQHMEGKEGSEEFFTAKGEHAKERPKTSFGHESFVDVLVKWNDHVYDDKIAAQIHFGNWLRDFSQILDPKIVRKPGAKKNLTQCISRENLTKLIDIKARMEFEKGDPKKKGLFKVTPALLGVYRAVEHIDNPTNFNYSGIDPRSIDKDFEAPASSAELAVDPATSMKCYIAKSRSFMRVTLDKAAAAGSGTEGARLFGAGLHVLEDYFAHSNFVELSLRKLGYTKVLPWTSKANCKQEYPVVTGMFASLDVVASVAGMIAELMFPADWAYKKHEPNERTPADLVTLILLDECGNEYLLKNFRQYLALRDTGKATFLYEIAKRGAHFVGFLGIQKKVIELVANSFIHHLGNSVDDAQVYLNGDPNTNGSTNPSHSQLAKDHDDHPFHTLAGLLAAEAILLVGKEMSNYWDGDKRASPGLTAAKFLVHPNECRWQDKIVAAWAKTHPAQVNRGESATALEALEKGHLKEARKAIKVLGNDVEKLWDYLNKYFPVIFKENNQVELWTKYFSR